MSYIPKQDKTPKVAIPGKIREDVLEQLKRYADYLESDPDYVIEQTLLKAFKADKGFQKSNPGSTKSAVRKAA